MAGAPAGALRSALLLAGGSRRTGAGPSHPHALAGARSARGGGLPALDARAPGAGRSDGRLRVYATCRARLAEELQVKPSADTVALAEHIRASAAASRGSHPLHSSATAQRIDHQPSWWPRWWDGKPPFSQLVEELSAGAAGAATGGACGGEAGIGKTRLARECGAWASSAGRHVLSGQAFEMGGRLPYQPLVEALRPAAGGGKRAGGPAGGPVAGRTVASPAGAAGALS